MLIYTVVLEISAGVMCLNLAFCDKSMKLSTDALHTLRFDFGYGATTTTPHRASNGGLPKRKADVIADTKNLEFKICSRCSF